MKPIRIYLEEYAKHSALNFGQAMQGLRYFHSHPDFDRVAKRGSLTHFWLSVNLRSKRVGNDLFFAIIPPHWHHTPEELKVICGVPFMKWFAYGYCAWRFDEKGGKKTLDGSEDPRWDPRCHA